ncbi:MAG: class I SAM-dependent methyltransferase [Gammaproteobacteria bacterium]|nr:class I SAM-dependent methyltransferase [Gammaproteobacteria bacterium]NNF61209.1 class I SAM-dependent methyltransferase [Gammaproteobacteria bacterium]NNM20705.1 class I SAM-dependent methyltransferase [Gammaproteobacteria bacterium]
MSDKLRESENATLQNMLLGDYVPDLIREARERQDAIMIERFQGKSLRIADIGCGDGYHGSIFAPQCELYHGFEIAPQLAQMTRDRWALEHLGNTQVFEGDVAQAQLQDAFYDLAVCLYFTPGNFRDVGEDLELYTDEYLDHNPVFTRIMSRFYQAVKPGGLMFLTVYRDVPEAEAAQYDFYTTTGHQPVSPPGARYVATADMFWSARWTRRSMLSNLADCGIDPATVTFHELNPIAWLVEIAKPT